MAYNDDAVLAKLSSLSETQDSIVSVAQWIMFYRYSDPGAVSSVVIIGFVLLVVRLSMLTICGQASCGSHCSTLAAETQGFV